MVKMRLYEFSGGYVFAALDPPCCNAWGQYVATGTIFDTVEGTVQTGKVAVCNLPADERDIVAGAGLGAGYGRIISELRV